MTGAAEGRREEAGKADEEATRADGRGEGKEGEAGWDDPLAAGEGAAKSERAGANEVDNRSAAAAEGRGADVGEGLT